MIEQVTDGDKLCALIIRRNFSADGIHFFTPSQMSQQLAYMRRPAGYVIDPHVHQPALRSVWLTQEVLFMRSGRVRADFYSDDRSYLESRVLEAGDVLLLASGGHGFHILEECEIIEVKQGPYAGDDDKVRFVGIQNLDMENSIPPQTEKPAQAAMAVES